MELPNLADVIAEVKPAVVAINTRTSATSIFGTVYSQEGAGSGWIIDSNGLIVTNNHVIEDAESVTVTLDDGRQFDVVESHADSVSDLAILRINAQNLPVVQIGSSQDSRVGDWVVAIGNSLGQGISATKGIVSALGVSIEEEQGQILENLIQTDAAINPGNSGGPLINLAGQVIGINSVKVAQVGVEGMGYAISTQTAIPILNQLVSQGYVTRPWLGVQLYTVDGYAIDQLDLKVAEGVLLTSVVDNGPAAKAGLQQWDVITEFDGVKVTTTQELIKLIREQEVGATVKVTYWRGAAQNTVNLTLEQSPPSES
jgi:serine protease Do